MKTPRQRASAILPLCALTAPLLCAQTVSVWLTTDDRKALLQPKPEAFFSGGTSLSLPTLVIDDRAAHQVIEGFGASMTDSSAYLLAEVLPTENLPSVMLSLFDHAQGIGVSFLRNPMGASDLARTVYSYDDQPPGAADSSLAAFSIDHDRSAVLPLLVIDRKSTRLNSSHQIISYAVFCLKKKNK